MKKALNLGPVLASIKATSYIFKDFKSGIINDAMLCNEGEMNHAVLVVGYGTDVASSIISGTKEQFDYFIIKNSFGPKWGDQGFAKISARNDFLPGGVCGILSDAYFIPSDTKQISKVKTISYKND
jgi:hypothetical protein